MNSRPTGNRIRRFGVFACWMIAASAASTASAGAAPRPSVYSDVRITFAGETFGLLGVQTSFSESQDGGRIVFDLTTIGTSDYLPLPEIDTSTLPDSGNHWEVVSKLGSHSYLFAGTCASETFSTTDSNGTVVRHMFLNCRDMSSNYTP